MLLEKIKSDALEARKARNNDVASLLTTLYSEAGMIGKNDKNRLSTDEEVMKVIEKFIKNANEIKGILEKTNKDTSKISKEIEILGVYLPQKMTIEELKSAINMIIDGIKDGSKQIGTIMSALKEKYNGKYDGKTASNIIREVLSEV